MSATAIFIACNDCDNLDLPEGTPSCIKNEINSFKKTAAICDGYHVSSFETQIGKVYAFADGNCVSDGGSRVLDSQCNDICFLGGFAANYVCVVNGDTLNFADEKILWEK